MASRKPRPCGVPLRLDRDRQPDEDGPLCAIPRAAGKVKCVWHWLMNRPIELQVTEARRRKRENLAAASGLSRPRVPESEWPEGTRWCSGCQGFVPLFYVSGSRCRACASQASHAGHVERTYGLSAEEYEELLQWQGGRCFICGQVPRSRRLAVDHDHRTGRVRGLLCSNDEHGCNHQLRRLLNDVGMARRALEYVEQPPLDRLRASEPARLPPRKPGLMDALRAAQPVSEAAPDAGEPWNPFG